MRPDAARPEVPGTGRGAPIGFYLLFASLFGGGPSTPGQLPGTVEIMVAMAAYGAIWGVLSATGPRISQERTTGWAEQLRALPLNARQVLLCKLAAGMLVALPAIALVCLTAALAEDVRLALWQWAALAALLWTGSLPFALLGTAIGYAVGAEAAFPLSYALYMAVSATGGLWVPRPGCPPPCCGSPICCPATVSPTWAGASPPGTPPAGATPRYSAPGRCCSAAWPRWPRRPWPRRPARAARSGGRRTRPAVGGDTG
ncbi:ABC transporter permease [Streptacidiphilus sp. 4-A2]|nr:ABC transporter permease [Streptacidiphilus sp. 4-A2]